MVDPTRLEDVKNFIDVLLLPFEALFNSGKYKAETKDRDTGTAATHPGASATFDSRFSHGTLWAEAEADLGSTSYTMGEDVSKNTNKDFGSNLTTGIEVGGASADAGLKNYSATANAEAILAKWSVDIKFKIFGQNFRISAEAFLGFAIGATVGTINGGKAGIGIGAGIEIGWDGSTEDAASEDLEPKVKLADEVKK